MITKHSKYLINLSTPMIQTYIELYHILIKSLKFKETKQTHKKTTAIYIIILPLSQLFWRNDSVASRGKITSVRQALHL